MEGRMFALDIIRDWGINKTESRKERRSSGDNASIRKLASHYFKTGKASSMDEALGMATRILR